MAASHATRKWAVDFGEGASTSRIPDPPGFAKAVLEQDETTRSSRMKDTAALQAKKEQKMWEFARKPFSQILMMCFMSWMAGGGVQIFSIMIVAGGIWSPVKAIQGVNREFKRFEDGKLDTFAPKLLYCAINAAGFAFFVYKLNSMGLLPTSRADWVFEDVPPAVELSRVHEVGPKLRMATCGTTLSTWREAMEPVMMTERSGVLSLVEGGKLGRGTLLELPTSCRSTCLAGSLLGILRCLK
eukprot:jgi/Mesvir1/7122/Mv09224-RA.1